MFILKLLRFMFPFTLFILTGRMSMKQDGWLHSDGSGTVHMELAIEMNAPSGMGHPFAEMEGLAQVDLNLRNIKLGEPRDGKSVHYTLKFNVLHWQAFATAPTKISFPSSWCNSTTATGATDST